MKERIFYFICVVAVMAAIFVFSAQNSENTYKSSDIIVNNIESRVRDKSDKTFDSEKDETDYWKKFKNNLQFAVRKSAHGFIYGVLGICAFMLFKSFGFDNGDAVMAALLLCVLYAGSDELHQKFINGRDSRMQDVCIDTFGAWVGIGLVYIGHKIKALKKNKTKSN